MELTELELDELFNEDIGKDATVNGVPVRIIPGRVSKGRSSFSGELETTWPITMKTADIQEGTVPEALLTVNGEEWEVDQMGGDTGGMMEITLIQRTV